jgi:MoxR-like ATPase
MSLRPDQRKFRDELADDLGLDADGEIWCSAPGEAWQLRNRLWQGEPRSQRFPLGVAFIENPVETPTAVSNAVERLAPATNGFDAVAMVEKGDGGRWELTKVIEPVGGTLAWKLKSLSPDVEVVHVSPRNTTIERPKVGPSTTEQVKDVVRHLAATPNVVLQGPPGTGKTYIALRVAEAMAQGGDLASVQFSAALKTTNGDLGKLLKESWFLDQPLVWELVQMHPGYTYDDFVRGRTLVSDKSGSRFESVDRMVPQMAAVAAARGDKPTLLIVDEINRCNLANVLGELILALDADQRGKYAVRLQYPPPPGTKAGEGVLLTLPPNLKVLGTMNTADRSIALIDFAIRRRFRFIDLMPDPQVIEDHYAARPTAAKRVRLLFDAVSELVVEHLRVGHSYFLVQPDDEWPKRLANRFVYEVLPLLREYLQEGHLLGSHRISLPPLTIDVADTSAGIGETSLRDGIEGFLAA